MQKIVLFIITGTLSLGLRSELPAASFPSTDYPQEDRDDISESLEPVREEAGLPALAAAVVREGRVIALGAAGLRKYGEEVEATPGDRFHLGSCTKAMTATLAAILVEEGKLRWDSTLGDVFPELLPTMHSDYLYVTLHLLLMHRGGCPNETTPKGVSFVSLHNLPEETMIERRLHYSRLILKEPPEEEPGTKYIYSNAGYVIVGSMMERVTGLAWEELLQEKLFAPLGITTAGFGAMGSPGSISEPWQHRVREDRILPVGPGPRSDNPLVIGPAGTVHMSLEDWSRFVAAHLDGRAGVNDLLSPESWEFLHRLPAGGTYACGWVVVEREWAGGEALTHAGSNTMNYALVWASVKKRFAVLVATNIAKEDTPGVLDQLVWSLITRYLDLQDLLKDQISSSQP